MTRFQKLVILTNLIIFIMSATTIGVLLHIKAKADKRLQTASAYLRELGEQYIETVVHVEQTIPLKTEVNISRSIPVNIDMFVSDSVLIQANIPVHDSMDVPINLNINQDIAVDTAFKIEKRVKMHLFADVPINQKFKMTMFGKNFPINVPVEA